MKQTKMISRHPGKRLIPCRSELHFVLLKAIAACKIMGLWICSGDVKHLRKTD